MEQPLSNQVLVLYFWVVVNLMVVKRRHCKCGRLTNVGVVYLGNCKFGGSNKEGYTTGELCKWGAPCTE